MKTTISLALLVGACCAASRCEAQAKPTISITSLKKQKNAVYAVGQKLEISGTSTGLQPRTKLQLSIYYSYNREGGHVSRIMEWHDVVTDEKGNWKAPELLELKGCGSWNVRVDLRPGSGIEDSRNGIVNPAKQT